MRVFVHAHVRMRFACGMHVRMHTCAYACRCILLLVPAHSPLHVHARTHVRTLGGPPPLSAWKACAYTRARARQTFSPPRVCPHGKAIVHVHVHVGMHVHLMCACMRGQAFSPRVSPHGKAIVKTMLVAKAGCRETAESVAQVLLAAHDVLLTRCCETTYSVL